MDFIASVNGKIEQSASAHISLLDRGFLFGDNIFEVMVAIQGVILNKDNHLKRLRRSAEQVRINVPWSDEELSFELETIVETLKLDKTYLRLTITRGEGLGLAIDQNIKPNRYLVGMKAKEESPSIMEEGISLQLQPQGYTSRETSAKTGNYLNSILALERARSSGYDDVLFHNADSEITECSTANIFLLGRDGDLLEIATPAASSGILLGITRATIAELLTISKIPVTERVICNEEIARFDEAFICSTVRGLIPVKSIDGHRLHTTRKNAIFNHVRRLHGTWVHSQIGFAVDWRTGKKTS